ncbi:MAG: hypothetical protein AB7Q01_14665 [Gammaproteobacteria bacterium]
MTNPCIDAVSTVLRQDLGREPTLDELEDVFTTVQRELRRAKRTRGQPTPPPPVRPGTPDQVLEVTARDADGRIKALGVPGATRPKAEIATRDANGRVTSVEIPGKPGTKPEVLTRDAQGRAKLLRIAKKLDPTSTGLPDGRLGEGELKALAQRVEAHLMHKQQLAQRRLALAIERQVQNRVIVSTHPEGGVRGLLSLLIKDKADRGATLSIEDRARAITRAGMSQMVDIFDTFADRLSSWGLRNDSPYTRALVKAFFGEDTSTYAHDIARAAKAGAERWEQVAGELRERFNLAGGDIGLIDNWAIPQSHAQERVRLRGVDAWVNDVLPLLDRARYTNVDGSTMSTKQVKELLYGSWETIATGGLARLQPGTYRGPGMVANRHQHPRILHFENADAWLKYHHRYGEKSILGTLTAHVEGLAREVALLEVLGPNPRHAFTLLLDEQRVAGAPESAVRYLQNVFAHLTGEANRVEWHTLARFAQGARNLQTAAKLGGAVLSSVTDFASSLVTARFNRLPFMQHARNVLTALDPRVQADVRLAQRAGIGLDAMLGELNRWADDSLGGGWSAKLAQGVMRASGLQALTEANRRAFSVTMMSTMGHLSRTPWESLHAADRAHLTSYGLTPADWRVLSRVTLEDWGGGNHTMLTPHAIAGLTEDALGATGADATRLRNDLVAKTLGMILSEESYAVVTPGVRERALMIGNLKKGTAAGEIARSLWLFKSFPVAVIAKHWMRGWGQRTVGGKAAYLASYLVGSTVLGALAVQLKDLAKGREPRETDTPQFWSAAFLQGGGASLFGDFALSDQSRYGRSFTESLLGPLGSSVADVYDLTLGNVHQAARGEPTDAGAEAVRFVQANTPGMSLWYARAALDHLMFHQLQEYVSPGYLRRMRRRVREETGQDFWWTPGQVVPGR